MNGKVESYRMNDPIRWEEFKKWPDEHKVTYIKLLREKWGVPDSHIAEMMGVSGYPVVKELARLGISGAKKNARYKWDIVGFKAWAYGVPVPETAVEPAEAVQAVRDDSSTAIPEEVIEDPVPEANHKPNAVNFEVAYKVVLDELEKANVEMELLRNELKAEKETVMWLRGFRAAVETIFQKEE